MHIYINNVLSRSFLRRQYCTVLVLTTEFVNVLDEKGSHFTQRTLLRVPGMLEAWLALARPKGELTVV